jgi:type IV secretory pathway VirB2 component (pilin)
LQPINEVSEHIQGFMTGRLATSLAVIAVAVSRTTVLRI